MWRKLFEQSRQKSLEEKMYSIFSISEKMKKFIQEVKESDQLPKDELKKKYYHIVNLSKFLGKNGWVISEHLNPRLVTEWYKYIKNNNESEIISYFEENNQYHLKQCIDKLSKLYIELPLSRYFNKGIYYFNHEDYMTSAMYLIALLEETTNQKMRYPVNMRYSDKYSSRGFKEKTDKVFSEAKNFFEKEIKLLYLYPAFIEYMKRTFTEGKEYRFDTKKEPPYINRNWLLHGKSKRDINRKDCIQIIHALSTFEYMMNNSNLI